MATCGHAMRISRTDAGCPWCRDIESARRGAECIAQAKIDESRGQTERMSVVLDAALHDLYEALVCLEDEFGPKQGGPPFIDSFEQWLARRTGGR